MGCYVGCDFVFFKIVEYCECYGYCGVDVGIWNVSSIIDGNGYVYVLKNIYFLLVEGSIC